MFGVPFSVKDTGSGVLNGRKLAVIYGGNLYGGVCCGAYGFRASDLSDR